MSAEKKPFLCRLGLHTDTFYDTTARNIGSEKTPIYYSETVQRCNKCGAEVPLMTAILAFIGLIVVLVAGVTVIIARGQGR